MWDLPDQGVESMLPALAGRILIHCTTNEVLNRSQLGKFEKLFKLSES